MSTFFRAHPSPLRALHLQPLLAGGLAAQAAIQLRLPVVFTPGAIRGMLAAR